MEPINVLYVEDEPSMAKLVGGLLAGNSSFPCKLMWADTLASGLGYLAGQAVDLILLDLLLPDSRGTDTLDRMREAAPSVPIVVLTGQAGDELMNSILAHGAQEFLPKDELRAKVLLRSIRFAQERKKAETAMIEDKSLLEARVQERTRELREANRLLMTEIEERRRVEEALRKSDEQSRMLLDSMPLAIAVYDMQGKMIFANAAFSHIFGWSREELIGHRLDFVPPGEREKLPPHIERMKQGLPVPPFETVRLKKSGEGVPVRVSSAPYHDVLGRLVGNIVTFRDITHLRQVEMAKVETERRYQNLVEAMSEGLVEVNENLEMLFYNESFARMLGYSQDELLGRRTPELITERSIEAMNQQWEKRRRGHTGSYEMTWKKKDGTQAFTLVSGRPRFDAQGGFKGSIALITNISERKILESQLLQAQKLEAIGQLAAGIAHEINTPTQYVSDNTRFLRDAFSDLTQVLGGHLRAAQRVRQAGLDDPELSRLLEEAESLYRQADGDYLMEEAPRAIEQTLEGLNRISTIVRSMKEFAHPGPDTKTPTDINRAIENTVTVAKNEWKYVAEVVTDLDPSLPLVPCVPGEVNQVFLNIIVNAAHAIAETVKEGQDNKGVINIATRQVEQEAEIRISDTGPGVPAAIRDRVFDPFFTTKPPGKGTGQGLAIAYRAIVDKHGGKLTLESEEGRGTTFVIRLPL